MSETGDIVARLRECDERFEDEGYIETSGIRRALRDAIAAIEARDAEIALREQRMDAINRALIPMEQRLSIAESVADLAVARADRAEAERDTLRAAIKAEHDKAQGLVTYWRDILERNGATGEIAEDLHDELIGIEARLRALVEGA